MAFDREVRALGGIKGFLDRLRRRQYIGEVANNTKDALEGHIKKIRAEKHVAWITNHLADNVEGITLNGSESLFEPDGNEVKSFMTFDEPLPANRAYIRAMAGVVYEYIQIPDPWAVKSTVYSGKETRYCTERFSAMGFDGSGDTVDLGTDVSLWSQALTKFSFTFWIIPLVIGDGNFHGVLNRGNYAANGFSVWQEADGTEINFDVFGSGDGEHNARGHLEKGTGVAYHIACVYDSTLGSANLKIYVDAVLGETDDINDTITNATDALILGSDGSDYNGFMWDFRWFTTRALTQQQVTDTMNNSMQAPIPDYWLPMNSHTGQPIDIISQTKTGIMSGADYEFSSSMKQDYIWIANTMTFGSVPTILSTGYSLGLNITTTNQLGNTVKRKNQFITFDHERPHGNFHSFDGTTGKVITEAHKASLTCTQFAIACYFRTSSDYSSGQGYLVVKGQDAVDTAGQNMNYFLRMNNDNEISGGYEENNGTTHTATSDGKVNDGKWHFVCIMFDGSLIEMYLDGKIVSTNAEVTVAENNTLALFLGAELGTQQFFIGDMSNVMIWNNDLTNQELDELYYNGKIPQSANLVYVNYMGGTSFDGIEEFVDTADTASLRLTQFSVACRFRTTEGFGSEVCLVGKGGFGSDTAGQNDNYSLRMGVGGVNSVRGGFEEGTGTDHYATSPLTYNDGEWHIAIVTYDQVTIRLYIDGIEVATHATTTSPETVNTNPLRVGANPRALDRFFRGDIDYVIIWNNDLTATEIADFQRNGTIPQTGAIVNSQFFRTVNNENTTLPLSISHEATYYWIRQNFSESIWFYATDLTDSGKDRVIKIDTFDDNNYHSYMIDSADNKLFIEFVKGGSATRLESTVAVTANAWHHLAVTWEHGTPTIKGRLDDVAMVASAKVGHAPIAYHKPCFGGYPRMLYHEQFVGLIDLHMYYKHDTVLTTGEMTNVKNNNSKYSMSGGRVPCISGAVMSAT